MGKVQTDQANINVPFIKSGQSFVKNGIIVQDAQRATDLLQFTVMGFIASSKKWTPFISLTTTTGASVPQGIYLGDDISAADLVAGDIDDCEILVGGGCTVDSELIVFDADTLNKDSIINAAAANPYDVVTAEAMLRRTGIFIEDTEAISDHDL